MSGNEKKTAIPEEFDDAPELTEDDFARADWELPNAWKPSDGLRRAAAELRHQADLLDQQADMFDGTNLKKAG